MRVRIDKATGDVIVSAVSGEFYDEMTVIEIDTDEDYKRGDRSEQAIAHHGFAEAWKHAERRGAKYRITLSVRDAGYFLRWYTCHIDRWYDLAGDPGEGLHFGRIIRSARSLARHLIEHDIHATVV